MHNEIELRNWLILNYTKQLSAIQIKNLHAKFTHPSKIIDFVLNNDSIKKEIKKSLTKPPLDLINKDLLWQTQPNQYILHINSIHYPALLKHTAAPPPIIYIKGNPNLLSQPQIAMVGSRKATPYGLQHAYNFSHELSRNGLIITSGLALGVDTAAHQGALQANQATIAVLGSGIEHIYPKSNQRLAKEICTKGALLSEFPVNSAPCKANFPRRNRIISGLSLATVVIEASLSSGSLITAKHAIEQGRDVFALPSSVQNKNSKGTHHLIRNGAYLIEKYDDILTELKLSPILTLIKKQKKPAYLDQPHKNLLECVDFAVTNINDIYNISGLSFANINDMLLNLEIDGYIEKITGGYIRVE